MNLFMLQLSWGVQFYSRKWIKLVLLLCDKNQIYQGKLKELLFVIHLIFFGKRLIVPEYYITELGQNHAPPTSDSIILNDSKIQFLKKPLDKLLTRSLLSKFESITDKDNLDDKLSKIDIVIGGDHS